MEEEDYSSLPLTERAVHKLWKVRQQAYEEMKKQFTKSSSESDGCFRPFVDNPGIYKKIVSDSNIAAQETGVASLNAFLEFGGVPAAMRTRSHVVSSLVEKGLASTRLGTRQNTVDALMWYIELDTPDPVLEDMAAVLSHKSPKLVVNTLAALVEIFKSFGAKTVPPKILMKDLPKLFAHPDKNVRAGAADLVVELYKWLGDGFARVILPDLKPVQQKELEEQFDRVKNSSPHQQRYLKTQRGAMERQGPIAGGDHGPSNDCDDKDAESDENVDMSEPVNVLSKFPADLAERLGSSKWKDRKEVLDEVVAVSKVPKIQNDDFGDFMRLLAKVIAKDANIMVVTVAANCVECLAAGLKQGFSRYQSIILAPLLERTKEKKTTVAEALENALDAIYKSSSLSDIVETTVEFLSHKTPQVKIEGSKFLIRCLKSTKICPRPNEQKLICEAGVKLLNDTQEPVRSVGAEILGVMMKIFGERALNGYMEEVDDIKKAKVIEFFRTAEVRSKPEKEKPKKAPPQREPQSAPRRPMTAGSSGSSGSGPSGPSGPSGHQQSGASRQTLARPTKLLGTPGRLVTPGSLKRPLNSPVKPPALSREPPSMGREREFTRDAYSQQSVPRPGLTNRSLLRPLLGTPGRSTQGASQQVLSDGRIAELEELQHERAEWLKEREQLQRKIQEDYNEKARLMQEINELQLRNAHLVEEHTRDVLAVKSKETQLIRAQSDADTARVRIAKLEVEVERLRLRTREQEPRIDASGMSNTGEGTRVGSSGTDSSLRSLNTGRLSSSTISHRSGHSPKSPSMTLQFGLDTRKSVRRSVDLSSLDSELSHLQAASTLPTRPVSVMLSSTSEEKENREDMEMADDKESWKRAAVITSQLKARIELMKRKTAA